MNLKIAAMNFDEARMLRLSTVDRQKAPHTSQTGSWADLMPAVRALVGELSLPQDELPVVLSARDASTWCLLTTRRLMWSHEGEQHALLYEKIEAPSLNLQEWTRRLQAPSAEWRTIEDVADRMEVADKKGNAWTVVMEPGKAPVTGVFNALSAVVHDCYLQHG
jgi:hypothetical protein